MLGTSSFALGTKISVRARALGRLLTLAESLARHDLILQFKRSSLGPLWGTIGLAVQIGVIAVVFSFVSAGDPASYVLHLAVGLVFWNFFSGSLNELAHAYSNAAAMLRQTRIPHWVIIARVLAKHTYLLGFNSILILGAVLIQGSWPGLNLLLVPLGVGLTIFILFNLGIMLATLGARFSDSPPMLAAILTVFFYATPIIWVESVVNGLTRTILELNPVYHMLEAVRRPLQGEVISVLTVELLGAMALLSFWGSLIVYRNFRKRIVLWL